jgi:hypothetical protein
LRSGHQKDVRLDSGPRISRADVPDQRRGSKTVETRFATECDDLQIGQLIAGLRRAPEIMSWRIELKNPAWRRLAAVFIERPPPPLISERRIVGHYGDCPTSRLSIVPDGRGGHSQAPLFETFRGGSRG